MAYTDANEGVYRLNGAKYCLVEKNVVFGGEFSPAMMWQANTIPVLSVLHRRTCLEKTGYFDEDLPVLEDWDLWLRFTFHYQFHYISAVTAEYTVRRDNTNMSQNTSDDKWMKIKCLIYRKYHNDIQVIADKNFRKLLIETVSWFFVTRMEWFSRMLSETETDPNVIAMLRFITLKTWVRIFKIKQYRRLALLITKKLIIKTFTLS